MKTLLLILSLVGAMKVSSQAQGTFQFAATLSGMNETVPNNSPVAGWASFTLAGNLLTYSVEAAYENTNQNTPTILGDGGTGLGSSLDPVYFNQPIQVTINNASSPIALLSLPVFADTNFVASAGNGFMFDWPNNTAVLNADQISELA